jgi:hypothetical protein
LNTKVPTCDTWGEQPSEFGGGTRRQWGEARGLYPPYTCLKDYSENGKSAAQIINDVSQEFSINPQVLIVLLQKEQGLVTDTWPTSTQYKTASGYGCPDTAPCDSQYYGLTNQLTWAARMFRAILNNSPTWYTPYILGNNYIQYNPNADCGGSNVNIQNRATRALYNYTPYQPNQAALDAGWGQAACGAYGNRNFYLYFTSWFGSTTGPDYSGSIDLVTLYSDAGYTTPINKVKTKYILQPSQAVYARIAATNTGRLDWNNMTNLGTSAPNDRSSIFKSPSWINPQRAATIATPPVKPYASSTFSFQLAVPAAPGLYSESFNIVQDGVTWMSAGFKLPIQVATPVASPVNYSAHILPTNSALIAGQSLISPDGYTTLSLSSDGVLQLTQDYQTVWSAGVSAGTDSKLIMQGDGNLVLYNKTGSPLWHTATSGNGASKLYVQEDGNMVIYKDTGESTWSSGTSVGLAHTAYPTTAIDNNGRMTFGQAVRSVDRKYNLYLQGDGNLVLYSPTRAIWASNTVGSKATKLVMQGDGNLVLYTDQGRAVWNSGTAGRGSSNLNIQPDGNMVVYSSSGATWASGTSGRQ